MRRNVEFMEQARQTEAGAVGPESEEVLVSDIRGNMTPAQMVEQKLRALLRGSTLTFSRASDLGDLRRVRA